MNNKDSLDSPHPSGGKSQAFVTPNSQVFYVESTRKVQTNNCENDVFVPKYPFQESTALLQPCLMQPIQTPFGIMFYPMPSSNIMSPLNAVQHQINQEKKDVIEIESNQTVSNQSSTQSGIQNNTLDVSSVIVPEANSEADNQAKKTPEKNKEFSAEVMTIKCLTTTTITENPWEDRDEFQTISAKGSVFQLDVHPNVGTANCASMLSLLGATIKAPESWNSETISEIMAYASNLYLYSIKMREMNVGDDISVHQIFRKFTIGEASFEFLLNHEVSDLKPYLSGDVFGNFEQPSLFEAITEILSPASQVLGALYTANDSTRAFFKSKTEFYLFESRPTKLSENAALYRTNTLEEFISLNEKFYHSDSQDMKAMNIPYIIHLVTIRKIESVKEFIDNPIVNVYDSFAPEKNILLLPKGITVFPANISQSAEILAVNSVQCVSASCAALAWFHLNRNNEEIDLSSLTIDAFIHFGTDYYQAIRPYAAADFLLASDLRNVPKFKMFGKMLEIEAPEFSPFDLQAVRTHDSLIEKLTFLFEESSFGLVTYGLSTRAVIKRMDLDSTESYFLFDPHPIKIEDDSLKNSNSGAAAVIYADSLDALTNTLIDLMGRGEAEQIDDYDDCKKIIGKKYKLQDGIIIDPIIFEDDSVVDYECRKHIFAITKPFNLPQLCLKPKEILVPDVDSWNISSDGDFECYQNDKKDLQRKVFSEKVEILKRKLKEILASPLPSQRGNKLFEYEDQFYTCYLTRTGIVKNAYYYRCVEFKSKKCAVRLVVKVEGATETIEMNKHQHSHEVDFNKINQRKCQAFVKFVAKDQAMASTKDIMSLINTVLPNEMLPLITHDNIIRKVNRVKNSALPPILETSRSNIDIPKFYHSTVDGDRFLLFDSGPSDLNRFIMFATTKFLRLLADCDAVFIDGTFKKCPSQFYQLFTLHGYKKLEKIPLVFCLLPGKTEEIYVRMFTTLKEKINELTGKELNPHHFTMDFERGLIEAIRKTFPRSLIHGCRFHHGGSLYRRLQKLDLANWYNKNEEFQEKIRLLFALQFLPENKVKQEFVNLVSSRIFFQYKDLELSNERIEKIQKFLDYFAETWVGVSRGEDGAFRHCNSIFSIAEWNQHDYIINNEKLSNNNLEAYHSDLRRYFPENHPPMKKFLHTLQSHQKNNEVVIKRFLLGEVSIKEPNNQRKSLKRIVSAYSNQPMDVQDTREFLTDVSKVTCYSGKIQSISKKMKFAKSQEKRENLKNKQSNFLSQIEQITGNSETPKQSEEAVNVPILEKIAFTQGTQEGTQRKRGRPKKVKSTLFPESKNEVNPQISNNTQVPESEGTLPLKRGRGRPRKNQSASQPAIAKRALNGAPNQTLISKYFKVSIPEPSLPSSRSPSAAAAPSSSSSEED